MRTVCHKETTVIYICIGGEISSAFEDSLLGADMSGLSPGLIGLGATLGFSFCEGIHPFSEDRN